MKIPEIKSTRAQSAKKTQKSDESGGTAFTDHLAPVRGPSSKADASGDAGAVVSVSSILSVQEVEEEEPSRAALQSSPGGRTVPAEAVHMFEIVEGGVESPWRERMTKT